MEKITLKDLKNGRCYASYDLIEKIEKKNHKNFILNFAYTDYGGSFWDKIVIEYFKKNHPNNILYESTYYNGQNALIFGDIAKDFFNQSQDYFLQFENIENFYCEMESNQYLEDFKYFIENIKNDYLFNYNVVLNYLIGNKIGEYNILSNMIDYSFEDLIKELLKENLIFNLEENNIKLLKLFIDNDFNSDIALYYYNSYNNNIINELLLNEQVKSIINQFEENN